MRCPNCDIFIIEILSEEGKVEVSNCPECSFSIIVHVSEGDLIGLFQIEGVTLKNGDKFVLSDYTKGREWQLPEEED